MIHCPFSGACGKGRRRCGKGPPSKQAIEHLHGVRDEAATRALIAQENRRYARRQLIWFRKEPNLTWFDGPGSEHDTIERVMQFVDERLQPHSAEPIPPDTHHAR